jgi:heat shock protein HtpX
MWNRLKVLVLLGGLSAVLVVVGAMLGPAFLIYFAVLALALNVAGFFADRLLLAMHGARDIGPDEAPHLHRLVEELAKRAGIPKPRLCVLPEWYANSFATGRNARRGVLAVSRGLLWLLEERELRGVLAHAIAHIKSQDTHLATVAAMLGAAVTYVPHALAYGWAFTDHDGERSPPPGGFLLALVAPLAALFLHLGIRRSQAYRADETAARLTGDGEGLALALEKLERAAVAAPFPVEPATANLFIVNPLAGVAGAVRLLRMHPPTEERVRRLREGAGERGGKHRAVDLPLTITGFGTTVPPAFVGENDTAGQARRPKTPIMRGLGRGVIAFTRGRILLWARSP